MPSPPFEDPHAIFNASLEVSKHIIIPSCLASKKNSEKSKGHTLKY